MSCALLAFFLSFCVIIVYDVFEKQNLKLQVFQNDGAAGFAASNCTCDKIVISKQVFVAFSIENEINIPYW